MKALDLVVFAAEVAVYAAVAVSGWLGHPALALVGVGVMADTRIDFER